MKNPKHFGPYVTLWEPDEDATEWAVAIGWPLGDSLHWMFFANHDEAAVNAKGIGKSIVKIAKDEISNTKIRMLRKQLEKSEAALDAEEKKSSYHQGDAPPEPTYSTPIANG